MARNAVGGVDAAGPPDTPLTPPWLGPFAARAVRAASKEVGLASIVIQQGSDESVLIPVDGAEGYSARAVVREWPDGPALCTWRTTDGSAVIDSDGLHLLTDRSSAWLWRRGELDVQLTAPDGSTTVAGPYRVRVRPLISHG